MFEINHIAVSSAVHKLITSIAIREQAKWERRIQESAEWAELDEKIAHYEDMLNLALQSGDPTLEELERQVQDLAPQVIPACDDQANKFLEEKLDFLA